jgi:hypothetical protein
MTKRRTAQFKLSDQLLFNLLRLDSDGVNVINVAMDDMRPGVIKILVEGERFPEVDEGAEAPEVYPIMHKLEDGSYYGDWGN